MGLDIVAYTNTRRRGSQVGPDAGIDVYPSDHFATQADGVHGGYLYSSSIRYRVGSYSHYGNFREALAHLVYGRPCKEIWDSPTKYAGQPFVELINFSDCDGVIGPLTSAKLLEDFRTYRGLAAVWLADCYVEIYDRLLRAFQVAAITGFVMFD